ncbi:MAG: hypothetical protein WBD07_06610 [Vicinamibacterales bacterium]
MTRSTRIGLVLVLIVLAGAAHGGIFSTLSAQGGAQRGAQPAAPAAAQPPETMPALLFKEQWQQVPTAVGVPTSPRRSANQYWLASQSAVTNPSLEVKLYGADARNLTVYLHEGRYDLWSGLVGSPVAVLLRHRNSQINLTGLARVRATVRTGNLHTLHPALRLADGTLVAGTQVINTDGQFLQVDVSFGNQRWYVIEPDTLAVKGQAMMVDLAKVDEVGFVDLTPAGGHGSSGWVNISTIEVYAKPVPRG